jgi:hypothetical protein
LECLFPAVYPLSWEVKKDVVYFLSRHNQPQVGQFSFGRKTVLFYAVNDGVRLRLMAKRLNSCQFLTLITLSIKSCLLALFLLISQTRSQQRCEFFVGWEFADYDGLSVDEYVRCWFAV